MAPSPPPALIKGYLPVRVKIPSIINTQQLHHKTEETFFYVKEHRGSSGKVDTTTTKGTTTLFIANAPVVPNVRTRLLLKSLLGRFGDISRVTVVHHRLPDTSQHDSNTDSNAFQHAASSWTTMNSQFANLPSFLPPEMCEGKFAHVVFRSHKDMRRTLRSLTKIMAATPPSPNNNDNDDDDDSNSSSPDESKDDDASHLPGLVLEKIEIQTLADESDRQYREEQGMTTTELDDDDDDDDHDDDPNDNNNKPSSAAAASVVRVLADRYRASLQRQTNRDALLEECNQVMLEFQAKEQADHEARQKAASQPDEDGFVTVTYASQVGSKSELEQDGVGQPRRQGGRRGGRRHGGGGETKHQRSRHSKKKNKMNGASELSNFYRFQTKEKRKRSLQDLRRKFEDDLVKVKKMKEDKQYRPF